MWNDLDLEEITIDVLQARLASGAVSAREIAAAYLARIEAVDRSGPTLRSIIETNPDALEIAEALDRERAGGTLRGPLHGVPVVLKDNIDTGDRMQTTAGSLALVGAPARQDAPVASKLRAAGAVMLGKANLSEWANFRSTRSCSGWSGIGGQVGNAYARDRNPSGSSAGSGVAAAASFCAGAIGTETNGSILSPASVNGLVGYKPTVGVVSGKGVVPISPRQDTAGPMCRTVGDAAILASVIAERPLGFGSHGTDIEAFRLRGVRIGVMPVPQGAHPDTTQLFANARAVLEHEGAVTVDLKPPKAFDESGEYQLDGLLYEFKDAINAYLATLDPSQVDCKTLTDLIAFNRAHADQELIVFGQEIFEMADAKGPLSDAAYQKALAGLNRTADVEGLATLL